MRGKALALVSVCLVILGVLVYLAFRSEPDAAPQEASGPTRAEQRQALVARKMASRQDVDRSGVTATGQVVRADDGRPVAGALVLLTPKSFEQGAAAQAGETPEPIMARTDVGGGWQLQDIRPGRYMLSASAIGMLPAKITNVVLEPTEGASGLKLALRPGGHTLQGMVSDVGGGPVESAMVQVVRVDDGNLLRFDRAPTGVLTDAEGRYATQVPDGAFFVIAQHTDYVTVQHTVHVNDSDRERNFELVPAAVVEGVVRERGSGDPVPGAIVVANSEKVTGNAGGLRLGGVGQHRVIADADGHFRLRGLEAGTFEISATARGAASRQPAQVSIGIAENADGVEVLVDPAFSISGFAVDRNDPERGMEGVWIGAFSMRPPGLFAATQPSEADGYFEIVGVQPGHYIVAAVSESALPNLMGTSADVGQEDVTDVVVELDLGTTITGRVDPPMEADVSLQVDAAGGGLSGMLSAMSNAFVRGRSGEDGTFTLTPVAEGKVTLVAKTDDGRRGEVEIEVGKDGLEDVVVELEPLASVSGRVVDADGNPVVTARVTVSAKERKAGAMKMSFSINDNPMFGGGVPTREDGSFEVVGLEPGAYEIRVNPERGPALAWAQPEDPQNPTAPQQLEVPEAGVSGVELAVENLDGTITGVVLDPDGAPVADAWVTARLNGAGDQLMQEFVRDRNGGAAKDETLEAEMPPRAKDEAGKKKGTGGFGMFAAESPVLTDARGRFTIRGLRDGEYAVEAELSGRGLRDRDDAVSVGSDVTLTLDPLAGIDGTVVADGKPVEQFTIRVEGPTPRGRSVYSPQGEFAADRLDPGTYVVHVEADAGTARVEVEVDSDARASVEVELESYAVLRGKVVDHATGEPLPMLAVMATPADGGVSTSAGLSLMMGGGPMTGGDGTFEVGQVRPGKGTLMVLDRDASNGAVAFVEYEAEAGDEIDLGTLQGVPAGEVKAEDRGELGLKTTTRSWTERPLAPLGEDEEREEVDAPADPEAERLWVRSVSLDGAAYEAGLRPGDEIVSIDGRDVQSLGPQAAAQLLKPHQIAKGDTVAIEIDRDGSKDRITVDAV